MSDPTADAHEWLSIPDPDEERTWLFDITFLTSRWTCIFGRGCQGVLREPAPEMEQGCCSYGAHFTDDDDVARVEEAAGRLSADQWQYMARARRTGTTRRSGGATVTRIADGACIFLNRPGFPGGSGCALHRAALERGERPMDLKPDVCWQLPLRREDLVHGDGHVLSTVGEWGRRNWGQGGREFAWWCTEAPEAFTGARPVYRAMAEELEAMVGPAVYALLVKALARRLRAGTALPHPAVRRR